MGKREDEEAAREEAQRRAVEKYWQGVTDGFEKSLTGPQSEEALTAYRHLLHRAIMHFSRLAMRECDYSRAYVMDRDKFAFAAQLMAQQTRLALAAHKIDIEIARLDRQDFAEAARRRQAAAARKHWDQPHASQYDRANEPSPHLRPGERSAADVFGPAVQGADADGEPLP